MRQDVTEKASGGAFGQLLASFRRDRGLSQEELARHSGMSVRAIRDLERGQVEHPPRVPSRPSRQLYYPADGGLDITNGRNPYRGTVRPPGCPTIGPSGVSGMAFMPSEAVGAAAAAVLRTDTGLVTAPTGVQLGGIDNAPSEIERPRFTDAVPPAPEPAEPSPPGTADPNA